MLSRAEIEERLEVSCKEEEARQTGQVPRSYYAQLEREALATAQQQYIRAEAAEAEVERLREDLTAVSDAKLRDALMVISYYEDRAKLRAEVERLKLKMANLYCAECGCRVTFSTALSPKEERVDAPPNVQPDDILVLVTPEGEKVMGPGWVEFRYNRDTHLVQWRNVGESWVDFGTYRPVEDA